MNEQIRSQILTIAAEWVSADREVRAALKNWQQQAARAGLESGAYTRMGKVADGMRAELGLDEEATWAEVGQAAYKIARLA